MKQNLYLYSATRGNVDGSSYASVWAQSEEVLNQPDTVGQPPMKINCSSELIDSVRGHLPGNFEVDTRMISAAGAKGGLYIKTATKSSKI
jgi:hypothetical protein